MLTVQSLLDELDLELAAGAESAESPDSEKALRKATTSWIDWPVVAWSVFSSLPIAKTALSCSVNPSALGTTVTFTASVTGTAPTDFDFNSEDVLAPVVPQAADAS